ncbi:putative chitinase 10 [Lucilia cuprina]|nr:putative chitinase 10 [Lucilia cuprina]
MQVGNMICSYTNKMFLKSLIMFAMFQIRVQATEMENKKKVVCYHGSWSRNRKSLGKFDIAINMNPHLCTHLIYAFYGIETSGDLRIRDPQLDLEVKNGQGNIRKFNDLKLKNSSLKTLLSVGGWNEGSTNFSIVAGDPLKRMRFLHSVIDFLQRHNFNDWEYPNQRHTLSNNDRENFVLWLSELKEGFKPYDFLLTAAVKAVEYESEKSYNITEMVKYLDFLNIMSYALNGIWSPGVGINAPLYAGPSDQTERAKQRVPRDKIVMGIPFYGRSFTLENSNNHSVGAAHTGAGIAGPYTRQLGILGYNELCEKFLMEKSLWHLEWESQQMVPYAYYDKQWIGYDNERSVELKVNYVNRENLGGIMIWTVELDDFRGVCNGKTYPLLNIINEVKEIIINCNDKKRYLSYHKENKKNDDNANLRCVNDIGQKYTTRKDICILQLRFEKKEMFMKFLLLTLLVAIWQHDTVVANERKNVVCYHGTWSTYRQSKGKFDVEKDIDPFLCTHLMYAFFGIEETGDLRVIDPYLDLEDNYGRGNIRKFNALKLRNPTLKTMLAVGGWNEGSKKFSIVAADPAKRARFVQSVVQFIQRHGFDGLDLDWEYPNQRHKLSNNDRENFLTWLRELKEGLEPFGYILSAAVGSAQFSAELSYNIPEMSKYLDLINVMAYDLHGHWDPVVGINSPLYAGPLDTSERAKQLNFDAIAKYWINQGAPREKLVMGVPFYGRSFTLADPKNHAVGAPHIGRGLIDSWSIFG